MRLSCATGSPRRTLVLLAMTAFFAVVSTASQAAESAYPNRPIRLIIGFPAGTTDDFNARVLGGKLTERLGQTVVVDSRSGASGHLAAEIAARANPDGYTLMVAGTLTLASSITLFPKLGYDLLKDFAYIGTFASGPNVLMAHPSLPVKNFAELLVLIKTKPASLRYGSAGLASTGHLSMELLLARMKAQVLHVPYKGGSGVAVAVAGGEVPLGFMSIPSAIPLIQAKRAAALAVTSAKRSAGLPDVPTIAESGFPGYDVKNNFGVFAPAGTPVAIVTLLNKEIRAIAAMDDVRAKLVSQGVDPGSSTPGEHRALMESEVKQWARVVKDAKITLN